MRLWPGLVCLLLVGCSGPHSSGGLWAQQELRQELVLYGVSDAQRADGARAYELGIADDALRSERSRLDELLGECGTTPRQPLTISDGDRIRDGNRIQAQGDPTRLAEIAQLALADWQLRRAPDTGDARHCAAAHASLDGRSTTQAADADDPFGSVTLATVVRDPAHQGATLDDATPNLALSSYALGYTDSLRARSPLPQYLAAVYGGTVLDAAVVPPSDQSAEERVDQLAPAHPEWEPDALYAALRTR